MEPQKSAGPRIPVSTYRLQFNKEFTFEQASFVIDHLKGLGISDVYSSPILTAQPGSVHGYDVVDHSHVNPELGGEQAFLDFARRLRQVDMGITMDVVPNHMSVAGSMNKWWLDVLENGPASPYARFFDIEWNPPSPNLAGKILLPILGDQFGRVLENQEIKIGYRAGSFFASYYETTLPITPRSSTHILNLVLVELKSGATAADPELLELESIITALNHLPGRTETEPAKLRERRREAEVIRRRLSSLVKESRTIRHAVHEALNRTNGAKGDPASFNLLEQILSEQSYRLSFWRVAADEINYRRFFDINDLAAIRVEVHPVFKSVHEIVLRLIKQGLVTGLRIDHVDGLFSPERYLSELQRECLAAEGKGRLSAMSEERSSEDGSAPPVLPFNVVVEKILGHNEQLRREWPVHGTTGYDFANLLNGVFVNTSNAGAFERLYRGFTGSGARFNDLLYDCKRLILRVAMSSELHVLARKLDRISEQHRWSRDFTFNSLQGALEELIACFPVYRSYIRRQHESVSDEDRRYITTAIRAARRRNPAVSTSIFKFIGSVLLLEDPDGLTADERAERRDFVMRFQQLTSPVMAKGLEDTAFYRFYPLASLNEVGGEPDVFGVTRKDFHQRNAERLRLWPGSMSATSTHDTKRSEDVRARINVLSEIPAEWESAIERWRDLNRGKKLILDGGEVPDANEEYLLYQTLIGAWPLGNSDSEEEAVFVGRIHEYMNKALREAKLHTSWINPDDEYEEAVRRFIDEILSPDKENAFPQDITHFQRLTTRAGLLNSLSQTLLKIASPGVPDFYQGTEIWNFSLVDPDNRRPVDYASIKRLADSLKDYDGDRVEMIRELTASPEDGRLKLFVTNQALEYRQANSDLFAKGEYVPLGVRGSKGNNVIAFGRKDASAGCIAVAGRFFTQLFGENGEGSLMSNLDWTNTVVEVGEAFVARRFREVFTSRTIDVRDTGNGPELSLDELVSELPVALLEPLDSLNHVNRRN